VQSISVGALNEQIKTLLEASFERVLVEGELSRITFHNSGHIYFTLKDSTSAISCVMFRGNASKLRFRLEEGLKVIVDGAITLYKPRGSYQINCFSIEPSGQGALALAFEQLKNKLSQKGYFEASLKKQLPKFPTRIALITSATGAAVQDMLRIAQSRYPLVEIDIYDVLVQGQNAPLSIANAIAIADTKEYDALVVGRGGGSIEDLWAFNEEIVADAIFKAKTPIVSAVGHEIDTLISDFVADLRAPTPTAAMQMILPDKNELLQYLDSIANQYEQLLAQVLHKKEQQLLHLKNLYEQNSIERRLELQLQQTKHLQEVFVSQMEQILLNKAQELELLNNRLPYAISTLLNTKEQQLKHTQNMLLSNNPKLKTKKGYAQLSKNNKVIELQNLEVEDTFELQDANTQIKAKVLTKK